MVKRYRDTKSMVYYRVDSGQKIPVIIRVIIKSWKQNNISYKLSLLYMPPALISFWSFWVQKLLEDGA